jgi:hypothetical protein
MKTEGTGALGLSNLLLINVFLILIIKRGGSSSKMAGNSPSLHYLKKLLRFLQNP